MDQTMKAETTQPATPISSQEFALLFDSLSKGIYNYCFRETADWAIAEDLTSIVFLEAWRRRDEVELAHDSAKPWLFGVAINVLRHRRRSLRRHAQAMRRLPITATTPDFSDDLAERLAYQERAAKTQALLRSLPVKYREVLALCDWSGLSTSEAGRALGVADGTVKSRLSRARQVARERIEQVRTEESQAHRLEVER
jgi:RNA polymerase sigma-70 factor (ECF subfamily)